MRWSSAYLLSSFTMLVLVRQISAVGLRPLDGSGEQPVSITMIDPDGSGEQSVTMIEPMSTGSLMPAITDTAEETTSIEMMIPTTTMPSNSATLVSEETSQVLSPATTSLIPSQTMSFTATTSPSLSPSPSLSTSTMPSSTAAFEDDGSGESELVDETETMELLLSTPTSSVVLDLTSSQTMSSAATISSFLPTSSTDIFLSPSPILSLSPSLTPSPDTTSLVTPSPTPLGPPHLQFLELTNPVTLPPADDAVSNAVMVDNTGFPTYNNPEPHTSLYVGSNGLISFGVPVNFFSPSLLPTTNFFVRNGYVVAPFWADVDTRRDGMIRYQVFDATNSNDNATIVGVSNYISQAVNNNFSGLWMMVAEWRDVHPYPHGSIINEADTQLNSFTNKTNTFQGVVITDGSRSYAVFIYQCGLLQWSGLNGFYRHAVIGYNMRGEPFFNHPLSGTSLATNVACTNSPTTSWSTLVYAIGDLESDRQRSRVECLRRYNADISRFGDSVGDYSLIARPCPCSLFQAFRDRRFWIFFQRSVFNDRPFSLCFVQRFPAATFGGGHLCCYSLNFGDFGALYIEGERAGGLAINHPIFSRTNFEQNDLAFHDICCRQAGRCDLFHERRPIDNCLRYRPPRRAWFWGDPHINTLDGRTYTFNGRGEYTLLSLSDQFELQARTQPVNTNTTATQFTACAMAGPRNGSRIEARIGDNNSLVVLVDGTDVTADLIAVNGSMFYSDNTVNVNRTSNTTVEVTFMSGVSVEVTLQVGLLAFNVRLPEEFMMEGRGLLGNFDGNKSNEFVYRNGTMIPDSSSDREIHNFGQSWQVSDSDSLFTYPDGLSAANFSFPDHEPVFLDELSNATLTEARRVCGSDSQCIYDFSQTGSEELAMVTTATNQENEMEQTITANLPPRVNGSEMYVITIGQPSTYEFMVTDTNEFNVTAFGGIGSLTRNGAMYTLTVHENDTSLNTTVSFVARDSLNASSMLNPQVLVCACQNGNCTLEGVLNRDADPLIMNCVCPEAYTGSLCDEDFDGCSEVSCFEGVICTDNPAPATGAMCGPCPAGLQGDGRKCIDIDECTNGTHNCDQMCVNTEGSFMCECRMGFELENTTHCRDINECSISLDNCEQICTNTVGGFNCSCSDGFILQPDMRTCIVDPDRNCSANNTCQQLCVRVTSTTTNMTTEKCSCQNRFTLDADMSTCNDIDECNGSNPCTQTCNNTIGSFVCGCESGYRLQSDGITCEDINECNEAALNSMAVCNNTQECVNQIGGFLCRCPAGSELNQQGLCIAIPLPVSTTAVLPSSTAVMMITTTTSIPVVTSTTSTVIATPTPPAASEVIITLSGYTEQTFNSSLRRQFMVTTAAAMNNYCQNDGQQCREVRNSERQAATVQPSDIVIVSVMNADRGIEIRFYVRGMAGGAIHQDDVVDALKANINLYTNDGFTVVSIQRVDPSPPLSTATIAGIVVGAVVGVILIVLCVLLIIYCCGCKCCRARESGKYAFVEKNVPVSSGEVVITNQAFIIESMHERDNTSTQSIVLKFGEDSSSEEEDEETKRGKNGDIKNDRDEKETYL